ncbi:MAG: hypothetical protein CVV27_05440 [Candidatus Melainabacteria bacterium HGW-Melainabacteria-1]|nr:MAG: hypothetical protein CVV27_05440 [Candidatus Melainabacteria bacterium HGW-Melainabacteria-1]
MTAAQQRLETIFGIRYLDPEASAVIEAREDDLYYYQVYAGQQQVEVARGDCVYWLSDDKTEAHLRRGPISVSSRWLATVIRGYMPENKTAGLLTRTTLPYINGCSTRQVFPPERLGDPTLQLLEIPPYSSEQSHHIHSTVRVVYVLAGSGRCIVGMNRKEAISELYPGQIVLLEKMCPHHFETDEEPLRVLPLHIYSSTGPQEYQHPMFNGTHQVG